MSSERGDSNEALPIEIHFKSELVIKADENNNNTSTSKHHVEEWGYDKENGPNEWGKRYPKALNGKHQSPIDIATGSAMYNEKLVQTPLEFTYDADCFHELKNTGHSFNVMPLPHASSSTNPLWLDFFLHT